MARITWQNVAAPDFTGATNALLAGSSMIGAGTQAIGGALGDYRNRKMGEASAQAVAKSMQYSDPDAWNRAMATSGLEGITGVSSTMLTPDALELLKGVRKDLVDQQDTLVRTKYTSTLDQNAQGQEVRDQFQETRDQNQEVRDQAEETRVQAANDRFVDEWNYKTPRTRAADAATDAAAAMSAKGAELADEVLRIGTITTVDEAIAEVMRQNLPLDLQTATVAALKGQAEDGLKISPQAQFEVDTNPDLLAIKNGATSHATLSEATLAGNEMFQVWDQAKANFGSMENPLTGLLDTFEKLNGKKIDDDGEGASNTSAGKIERQFTRLKEAFPGVSEAVIAQVMSNQLTNGNLLLGDYDALMADEKGAYRLLNQMNDPKERLNLERQSNALEVVRQERGNLVKEAERLSAELKSALSKGATQGEVDDIYAKITAVKQRFANFEARNPVVAADEVPTADALPYNAPQLPAGAPMNWIMR